MMRRSMFITNLTIITVRLTRQKKTVHSNIRLLLRRGIVTAATGTKAEEQSQDNVKRNGSRILNQSCPSGTVAGTVE